MLIAWCAILGFSQHKEDGVIRSDHRVAPRVHRFWVMMMAIIMLLRIMKTWVNITMMTRQANANQKCIFSEMFKKKLTPSLPSFCTFMLQVF